MKKIVYAAFTSVAALALAACGGAEKPADDGATDNAETMADSAVDEDAAPAEDAAATEDAAAEAATVAEEAATE
jgi:hypothetical protein